MQRNNKKFSLCKKMIQVKDTYKKFRSFVDITAIL